MNTENLTLSLFESWLFQTKNFTGDDLIYLAQPEKTSHYVNSLVFGIKKILRSRMEIFSASKKVSLI